MVSININFVMSRNLCELHFKTLVFFFFLFSFMLQVSNVVNLRDNECKPRSVDVELFDGHELCNARRHGKQPIFPPKHKWRALFAPPRRKIAFFTQHTSNGRSSDDKDKMASPVTCTCSCRMLPKDSNNHWIKPSYHVTLGQDLLRTSVSSGSRQMIRDQAFVRNMAMSDQ